MKLMNYAKLFIIIKLNKLNLKKIINKLNYNSRKVH